MTSGDHLEREDLARAADEMFADFCSPEQLRSVEPVGWHEELWTALDKGGFTGVSISEQHGGSGGSDEDALVLLRSAGRFAAPVPLAETGFLCGWLLAASGCEVPAGVRTVVEPAHSNDLVLRGDRLSGRASRVAWGHRADWVLALVGRGDECRLVVAPGPAGAPGVSVLRSTNLAGEPRDELHFDDVPVTVAIPGPGVDPSTLLLRGAAARSAQIAGALSATAALVTRYTQERRQFGRPLGAFQAVQAHVVEVHQQAALVNAALDGVLAAWEKESASFEVAALKTLANHAATSSARAAHQAHGAMGVTQEYPLHLFTRRLWAWRNQYGDTQYWSAFLGSIATQIRPDDLYSVIQRGSESLRA